MELIGMLDSPFVRRVAIGMKLLELPFTHRPLSVFGDFDAFAQINPVVKAPSLVLEDGSVLMESSLILDYLVRQTPRARHLVPDSPQAAARAARLNGLALVACEKSVQIVYERRLRPETLQHAPWLERVSRQLRAAWDTLEQTAGDLAAPSDAQNFGIAELTVAVAWRFTQNVTPDVIAAHRYPRLQAFSTAAEATPAFQSTPAC